MVQSLEGIATADLQGELAAVERAARRLTARELEVLLLSAGKGLCNARIAERLGISEVEAERLLSRALRRFDRFLASERKRKGEGFWKALVRRLRRGVVGAR